MNAKTETSSSSAAGQPNRPGVFVTTHWSLVLKATQHETSQAQTALEKLCQTYWYPLYAYARRRGLARDDAQDVTQAFFAKLLERQWLGAADKEKGRFRTFLLTAMERFLANEWDKARTLKRGGGLPHLPIQLDNAETRYGVEPRDTRTPAQAFEYRWALTLLEQVLKQLEAEYGARGQQAMFAALKPCLVGERSSHPYVELAARLGMGETALKVTVHRMRHRYRELLRAEIAQTVASQEEVDAEMKHLFGVLARGG